MTRDDDRKPIGYWLKHLDRLIDTTFERTLAVEQLTRRHWQVLNTLAAGPTTAAAVDEALAPFLEGDPSSVPEAIDDLVARSWAARNDDQLELTADGRRAHEELRERVGQTRRQLVDGISDDEYLAVIDVLRRMSANLERPG